MRTHEEILSEVGENSKQFERVVDQVPEPLISERLTPDEWSIKEILCHLADIQNVGVGRIDKILNEDNPRIEIYDEGKENRERNHQQDDMRLALAAFIATRSKLLSELKGRPARDWQRTGQHPEQENFTVEFILQDMLEHERKHFEQIKERIGRLPHLSHKG